ncbi:DMT family transporter [Micromonospora sp. NPDC000089]|uniref:DMT family transporter n=1 Tax=unclassified Micromonospora TaxID=2617518 RepID=UPI0036C945FC
MILAALASALCFALSATLHQRAAKRQPPGRALDPRLLLGLLRSRLWLSGWLPDTAAVVLQVVALRLGPLAVVQPAMTSGLFMAVLLEAAARRRRPVRRDLLAVSTGVGGLTGFIVLADVRAGVSRPAPAAWTGPAAVGTLIVLVCVLAAHRRVGAVRGALLGGAGGVCYGFAAALVKEVTGGYHGDPWQTLISWPVPALVIVGGVGLLLNQAAFQHGRLAAPLTALTLAEPVVATVLGVVVFREALTAEPVRIIGLLLAAGTAAAGVWLAATTTPEGHR